jgi:hypothetical protein
VAKNVPAQNEKQIDPEIPPGDQERIPVDIDANVPERNSIVECNNKNCCYAT